MTKENESEKEGIFLNAEGKIPVDEFANDSSGIKWAIENFGENYKDKFFKAKVVGKEKNKWLVQTFKEDGTPYDEIYEYSTSALKHFFKPVEDISKSFQSKSLGVE